MRPWRGFPLSLAAVALAVTACGGALNWTTAVGPRFGGTPVPPPTAEGADLAVPPATLVIASYNIDFARAVDTVIDVIARDPMLRRADVIAIQEADEAAMERLAAALQRHYVYYPAAVHPKSGRNFGPGILSRWPLTDDAKVALPVHDWTRGTQRTATAATVELPGRRFRFYSTHLGTMIGALPWGQAQQARALLDDAEAAGMPVIVAGDFNRMGVGDEFTARGFAWVTHDVGDTHRIWSFDHVFVRGVGTDPMDAGAVEDALRASDHKAVWARVTLAGS